MRISNEFSVPTGIDSAWDLLLDLERVAPCMPGASLTEIDGTRFTGTVKVKVGPIALTFHGEAQFTDVDKDTHRVVISGTGRDQKGNGAADATVTASMVPARDGTRVSVVSDLTITGRAGQFGAGVIKDISTKLIDQFAANLSATLADAPAPQPAMTAAGPEPVSLAAIAPPRLKIAAAVAVGAAAVVVAALVAARLRRHEATHPDLEV